MDSIGVFVHTSDDDSGDDQVTPAYIQRKRIRESANMLDMTNKRFVRLFRVSKELFMDILNEIHPHFVQAKKKDAIPPIMKLAATLRFMSEGSYQQAVGQDFMVGMAQPTVSIVIAETLKLLESHLCVKHIHFEMSEAEKINSKEYFLNKAGFPGVIGCVDGTHINIIRPQKNEHHFYNRKGSHSLNVMISCNYKMEITSVEPRFGGCSHDSAIWNMSRNRIIMEQNWRAGDKNSWMLGDSGYGLEPWMMTPYRNTTEDSAESRYNTAHGKARSIIERVFGVLKGRWKCLLHTREMHYKPEKAAQIVNVCCLLHNLCTRYKVPVDENSSVRNDNEVQNETGVVVEGLMEDSKRIRDNIKHQL